MLSQILSSAAPTCTGNRSAHMESCRVPMLCEAMTAPAFYISGRCLWVHSEQVCCHRSSDVHPGSGIPGGSQGKGTRADNF
jgi:hypothetical protein